MDLQIRSILNIVYIPLLQIPLLQIIVLFSKQNWFRFSEIKQVSQKVYFFYHFLSNHIFLNS